MEFRFLSLSNVISAKLNVVNLFGFCPQFIEQLHQESIFPAFMLSLYSVLLKFFSDYKMCYELHTL